MKNHLNSHKIDILSFGIDKVNKHFFLPLDKYVEKSSQSLYRDINLPLAFDLYSFPQSRFIFLIFSDLLPVVFPCGFMFVMTSCMF